MNTEDALENLPSLGMLENLKSDNEEENNLIQIFKHIVKAQMQHTQSNMKVWDKYYANVEVISRDEALVLYARKLTGFIEEEEFRKLKKFAMVKMFKADANVTFMDMFVFYCFKNAFINHKFELEYDHEDAIGSEIYNQYKIIYELNQILKFKNGSFDKKNTFTSEDIKKNKGKLVKLFSKAKNIFEIETFGNEKQIFECIKSIFFQWCSIEYRGVPKWKWSKGKKKHYIEYKQEPPLPYMEVVEQKLSKLTSEILFDVIPYCDELIEMDKESEELDEETKIFNSRVKVGLQLY